MIFQKHLHGSDSKNVHNPANHRLSLSSKIFEILNYRVKTSTRMELKFKNWTDTFHPCKMLYKLYNVRTTSAIIVVSGTKNCFSYFLTNIKIYPCPRHDKSSKPSTDTFLGYFKFARILSFPFPQLCLVCCRINLF